jgi:hypothetical protein
VARGAEASGLSQDVVRKPISHRYFREAVRGNRCSLVEHGASEPLEGQLVREAWNLRGGFPKAALVIGVAGAEIGFRRLVGEIGGRKSINKTPENILASPSSHSFNSRHPD